MPRSAFAPYHPPSRLRSNGRRSRRAGFRGHHIHHIEHGGSWSGPGTSRNTVQEKRKQEKQRLEGEQAMAEYVAEKQAMSDNMARLRASPRRSLRPFPRAW